jgi:hypothetical protein
MISVSGIAMGDLRLSVAPPDPLQGYSAVAWQMLHGVRSMTASNALFACCFVAAHGAERCLKGMLVSADVENEDLRAPETRHDLIELWRLCAERGFVSAGIPDWLQQLARLHKPPYHLRYLDKVHGISMPGYEPLRDGYAELVETTCVQREQLIASPRR